MVFGLPCDEGIASPDCAIAIPDWIDERVAAVKATNP
jgi:hypothetical protein